MSSCPRQLGVGMHRQHVDCAMAVQAPVMARARRAGLDLNRQIGHRVILARDTWVQVERLLAEACLAAVCDYSQPARAWR